MDNGKAPRVAADATGCRLRQDCYRNTEPQWWTGNDEEGGRSRQVLTLAGLLMGLLCVLLASCTMAGTPRASLAELRSALLNHDAVTALKYIDVDHIVDSMVKEMILKYEARAEDPEILGVRIGREVAAFATPAISSVVEKQVRRAIASDDQWGYFDDIRRSSVWYLAITIEGETATVKPMGSSKAAFRMAKTSPDVWRIIEITRR